MRLYRAFILEWVLSTSEAVWTNPGFCANIGVWSWWLWVSEPLPLLLLQCLLSGTGRDRGKWTRSANRQHSFDYHVLLICWKCPVILFSHAPLHVNVHLSKTLNSDFRTAPSEPHSQYFLFVSYKTKQMGPRDFGTAPNESEMHPELALCPKVQFSAASCP